MEHDPTDTCWTVVRAASRGDAAARSTFARVYTGTIRGYLRARWRGRALASELDDATQEVFVECLRAGGPLERADPARGDFRGLLFGVVRKVAQRFEERRRAGARGPEAESGWEDLVPSDEASLATTLDRCWAQALVDEARRRQRELALADGEAGRRRLELLERRFGNDEAIREIAAGWGVPAQDVHNLYRKARIEFYRCLRDAVAFHARPGADLDAECRRLLASLER